MTNGEKYKTAKEREDAFYKLCEKRYDCDGCELESIHNRSVNGRPACVFAWLDLEAEEEKPLPCIWCKHETYVCVGQNYGQVRCKNCMAEGPAADSKEHAIRNYNRAAKAVRESESASDEKGDK